MIAAGARLARLLAAALTAIALGGCAHFVILHDPLSASEHNDLGVAYASRGQTDLAAKEYRRSLGRDHHQSRARVNLGNTQAAEGRWHAAEKSYRRALRDSSTDADAMNDLAVALVRQGRDRDEARSWAERAVAAGGERESLYRSTLAEVDSTSR